LSLTQEKKVLPVESQILGPHSGIPLSKQSTGQTQESRKKEVFLRGLKTPDFIIQGNDHQFIFAFF
jgi:hypothetical protein